MSIDQTEEKRRLTELHTQPPSPPVEKTLEDKIPPDGGLVAYMQVAGSFLIMFNAWGLINCYGAFQTYYADTLMPNETASDLSWIGSIQTFLLLFVSALTGPAYDAGYFWLELSAGSLLMVVGTLCMSWCHEYWQFMLAQAICVGFGAGFVFVPSVAILSTYFKKHLAFVTGIAISGSCVGGIVYTLLVQELTIRIGFPWTIRCFALIMLVTELLALSMMRVRSIPGARRAIMQISALKEAPFAVYAISILLAYMGMYIPFFYVQSYALAHKIMSSNDVANLLVTMNCGSWLGRVIPNYVADHSGPFNVLIPCSVLTFLLAFVWIGIKNFGGLFVFCALYGFTSGAFVSLAPTMVVSLSPNLNDIGGRMGMIFLFCSVGLLTGTPIAGAIEPSGWAGLQVFCGATVAVATVGLMVARWLKFGKPRWEKA